MHQITIFQQPASHVIGIHLNRRLGDMAEQATQRTRTAHAMPLVTQAARGQ